MSKPSKMDLIMIEGAIEKMRGFGYAVVAFTPEELEGAIPESVEDRLIERGWDIIETLRD